MGARAHAGDFRRKRISHCAHRYEKADLGQNDLPNEMTAKPGAFMRARSETALTTGRSGRGDEDGVTLPAPFFRNG